jgi:hypothetical protein
MRLNYRSSEEGTYFFFHVKLFLPFMDRDVVCHVPSLGLSGADFHGKV